MSGTPHKQHNALSAAEDHAAIQAVAAGDVNKFAVLVTKYQNRVFRFILKNISDIATAEDLMQDTFMDAYRSLGKFEDRSRFSTWLIGIALNKVRNYINRAPDRRYRFVGDTVLNKRPNDGRNPVQNLEERELLRAVHKAVGALPDKLREPLILVSYEELSYRDAAVVLDIEEGTVKSRVYRARAAIRKQMKRPRGAE